MPDDEKKEESLLDNYLRRTGRPESAPVSFADLRAVLSHEPEPESKASDSSGEKPTTS